jgi:hypothetical protein
MMASTLNTTRRSKGWAEWLRLRFEPTAWLRAGLELDRVGLGEDQGVSVSIPGRRDISSIRLTGRADADLGVGWHVVVAKERLERAHREPCC